MEGSIEVPKTQNSFRQLAACINQISWTCKRERIEFYFETNGVITDSRKKTELLTAVEEIIN